jgi:hypothetical protein
MKDELLTVGNEFLLSFSIPAIEKAPIPHLNRRGLKPLREVPEQCSCSHN